jgi:hypothetical protein
VSPPGRAAYRDFAENLASAQTQGRFVQLVIDTTDRETEDTLFRYLEEAQRLTTPPGIFEITMLFHSETQKAHYQLLFKRWADRKPLPIVWGVTATDEQDNTRLQPFAQLLAALALAEHPSRMDDYDSLSSLRKSSSKFITNKIAWFTLPSLDWTAATLLKKRVWLVDYKGEARYDFMSDVEELLWQHNVGRNEFVGAPHAEFSARTRYLILNCLPALYAIVVATAADPSQAVKIMREISASLTTGLGSRNLVSSIASELIRDLTLEIEVVTAEIETNVKKLDHLASASTPLGQWINGCGTALTDVATALHYPAWSPLSLVESPQYAALYRHGQTDWLAAVQKIRALLLQSFVRWKGDQAELLGTSFENCKRTLQFLPLELSTNWNEELWPLQKNIAIIAQQETSL